MLLLWLIPSPSRLDMVDSNFSSFLLGSSLDHCGLLLLRGKRSQWDWVPSCSEVLHRLVALLSWWIAPWVPLPRSSSSWISGCCLLVTEMYIVSHSEWWLVFDHKLSNQKLSLVEMDNFQDMCSCLVEALHRISKLLLVGQCLLVG